MNGTRKPWPPGFIGAFRLIFVGGLALVPYSSDTMSIP
jgi:hypothetical protein